MIEPQVRNAVRLWYKVGLNVLDEIERWDWDISVLDFVRILTDKFHYHNINFMIIDTPEDNIREYVSSATFYDGGMVEVYIRPEVIPFLQKLRLKNDYMVRWLDPNRNQFVQEFVDVVSHELLHRKQHELGCNESSYGKNEKDYLSTKAEIQTHAQDAALHILHSREGLKQTYYQGIYRERFGVNHPVYKRFMKTLYKFVEKMKLDQSGHLL